MSYAVGKFNAFERLDRLDDLLDELYCLISDQITHLLRRQTYSRILPRHLRTQAAGQLLNLRTGRDKVIEYQDLYRDYIVSVGVGSKDRVASSPASYVSYLTSVSKCLGVDITPSLLRTERDVQEIARKIARRGGKAERTINNYCSAMRRYVDMVAARRL